MAKRKKKKPCIYIATNKYMRGLVKIGKSDTTNIKLRIKNLFHNQTGVPYPFECYYCGVVENADKVEKVLHRALKKYRIHPRREFFKIDPEYPKDIIEPVVSEDCTPGKGKTSIDSPRGRPSPKANFPMLKIRRGSKLTFLWDPKITARVIGDKKVEFRGKEMFLTRAAKEVVNAPPYSKNRKHINGWSFWCYKGVPLTTLYRGK